MSQKTTPHLLLVIEPETRGQAVASALLRSGVVLARVDEMGAQWESALYQIATSNLPAVAVVLDTAKMEHADLDLENVVKLAKTYFKPLVLQFKHDDLDTQAITTWMENNDEYDYQGICDKLHELSAASKNVDRVLPKGRTIYQESILIRDWVQQMQNLGRKIGRQIKAGKLAPIPKSSRKVHNAIVRFQSDKQRNGKQVIQKTPAQRVAAQRGSMSMAERERQVTMVGSAISVTHRRPTATVEPKNPPIRATQTKTSDAGTLPMSKDHLLPQPGRFGTKQRPTRLKAKQSQVQNRSKGKQDSLPAKVQTKYEVHTLPALSTNGKSYPVNEYWNSRKDMNYYGEALAMARRLAPDAAHVLDVGGRGCEYALALEGVKVTQVDPSVGLTNTRCTWVKADFMEWEPLVPDFKYDLAFCLQVLEHVKDPAAFLKRLFHVAKVVVISVPYNWPHEQNHLHHFIKPEDVKRWAGREADEYKLVKEQKGSPKTNKRMLFGYIQSPIHVPPQQPKSEDQWTGDTPQPDSTPIAGFATERNGVLGGPFADNQSPSEHTQQVARDKNSTLEVGVVAGDSTPNVDQPTVAAFPVNDDQFLPFTSNETMRGLTKIKKTSNKATATNGSSTSDDNSTMKKKKLKSK